MTTAAPAPRTEVTLRSRIVGAARYVVMPLRVLVLLPAMLVGRTLLGRNGEH